MGSRILRAARLEPLPARSRTTMEQYDEVDSEEGGKGGEHGAALISTRAVDAAHLQARFAGRLMAYRSAGARCVRRRRKPPAP